MRSPASAKRVTEVAAGHNLASTEGLVNTGGATGDEAKTERVGAVFADNFDRVNDVAFGFGHLLTLFIEYHTVHVDIFERNVVGGIETEHNHAANPLE